MGTGRLRMAPQAQDGEKKRYGNSKGPVQHKAGSPATVPPHSFSLKNWDVRPALVETALVAQQRMFTALQNRARFPQQSRQHIAKKESSDESQQQYGYRDVRGIACRRATYCNEQ